MVPILEVCRGLDERVLPACGERFDTLGKMMEMLDERPRPADAEVDWAGGIMRATLEPSHPPTSDSDFVRAYQIVDAFREAHQSLIELFSPVLRSAAILQGAIHGVPSSTSVDVGGRLKRIPTIIDKLIRLPRFSLSQLQDIAGIRAVVRTRDELSGLADELRSDQGPFRFLRADDYVKNPKLSGYRSIHHVYVYDVGNSPLNGLNIEVQLRTRLQHVWATTNEVVGTFRDESLKTGRGDPDWLRFFALAGAVFARQEGLPLGKLMPADDAEFSALKSKLKAFETIASYTVAEKVQKRAANPDGHYFVLSFNRVTHHVSVWSFSESEVAQAARTYATVESAHVRDSAYDTVLVSTRSMEELKAAYPNYFADTRAFLKTVYTQHERDAIEADLRVASLMENEEDQL